MRKFLVAIATFASVLQLRPAISAETPDASSGTPAASRGDLAEVLVTAQKRVERLQDVPVPVSVVSSDALLDSQQVRVQDYFSSVPGVSLTGTGLGGTTLMIRGLNTGGGNPTVGVTIDDVPYGTPNGY